MTHPLQTRMKSYEAISKTYLERKKPVVIRIDGKAFHTFTRGLRKPFDPILVSTMQNTMLKLCENIQNCVMGYTQSDEISLLLSDYNSENTDAWFGNSVQKICSVSASMSTLFFNNALLKEYQKELHELYSVLQEDEKSKELMEMYDDKFYVAMFDSRCFNLEFNEVTNYFIWRQSDAMTNSVQALGQSNFSHKQLQNKSSHEITNMLIEEKGIDWESFSSELKWGSCAIKVPKKIQTDNGEVIRNKWELDMNIPIFMGNRDYTERFVGIND